LNFDALLEAWLVVEISEIFDAVQNALKWRLACGGGSLVEYVTYAS
jgi:hypothetical protein